ALVVWLSLWVARRARPHGPGRQRSMLDTYGDQIAPIERLAMWALPLAVGVIAGASVASQWMTVLAWWHRTPFGAQDPQFGFDLSFYVFTLPAVNVILNCLLGV